MRNLSILLLLTVPAALPVARAGDTAGPRKEFHQSSTYPFVFRADSYLSSTGPAPMRFAPAVPSCAQRTPPPLTEAAKPAARPDPAAATKTPAETSETGAATTTARVPPTNTPQPPRDDIDFARVPDEVLDFFKNTEGRPVRRAYLFDPIFQPALPNELPKSKAIYQQK